MGGASDPQLAAGWKHRKVVARDLRAIYTTNAVEPLNVQLWKVTKKRGAFPTEDWCAWCYTSRSRAYRGAG